MSDTPNNDVNSVVAHSNMNVQRMQRGGQRINFILPAYSPGIDYKQVRLGKPCPKGTHVGKAHLCIFKRLPMHKDTPLVETTTPLWMHMLIDEIRPNDARSGKLRFLTMKDWDSISGGSAAKDFPMDVQVCINKKTKATAPLYSAEYLAYHVKRRERAQKTRNGKPVTKKRKRPVSTNGTSDGTAGIHPEEQTPGVLTPQQREVLKRAKAMTREELERDQETWVILGAPIMYKLMNAKKDE